MLMGRPFLDWLKQPRLTNGRENEWWGEKWASPYMAAIARFVFRGKPDVTLTPQLAPERIIERLGLEEPVYRTQPFGEPVPLEEPPMPNGGTAQYYAGLAAEPELSEWFKKNWTLVIVVVIVALVLLFFFLKKGRR